MKFIHLKEERIGASEAHSVTIGPACDSQSPLSQEKENRSCRKDQLKWEARECRVKDHSASTLKFGWFDRKVELLELGCSARDVLAKYSARCQRRFVPRVWPKAGTPYLASTPLVYHSPLNLPCNRCAKISFLSRRWKISAVIPVKSFLFAPRRVRTGSCKSCCFRDDFACCQLISSPAHPLEEWLCAGNLFCFAAI